MIIPYTELPEDSGGEPRPLLDVVVGDMDDILLPCLVDTGSLHSLLPLWAAEEGGIATAGAPVSTLAVAATETRAAFSSVRLVAGEHAWEADVGFCDPWPYAWGLLGQQSFFRFFTVTFRAADFAFTIEPNDR